MKEHIDSALQKGDLSALTTYQAGVLQASSNRSLQQFCDKVLKPFGISKMHWLIIGSVYDAGEAGARLTDLAASLDTTLPYLTNTVNLLASKGILVRVESDSDSRSKFIQLSEDFEPVYHKIEITLRQALRKGIYSQIDPAEFRVYMKVMYQLANFGLSSHKK